MIKIGILREGKMPQDKRVAFTPSQCRHLLDEYPGLEILVQPSSIRCFKDEEYLKLGIKLQEDLSSCDILIGIKEVPSEQLMEGKKYIFFSHTIKKQPHNQKLMKALISKGVSMIDYECLTDVNHNRIIGFGRYAGIVGAYNGLLGYGERYKLFHLKSAHDCSGRAELDGELKKVNLPNIKILVTGGGRVANGATEILGALKIRKVTAYEYLHCTYREPVYCQIHSRDYFEAKDGTAWNARDFYACPQNYIPRFIPYAKNTDLLICAHFWAPGESAFFTKDDMKSEEFRISVIADISCDINGSIPSTLRASTINEPLYGYNPVTGKEDDAFGKDSITVMAVDNLPCELPRDSSEDFGKELMERVVPALLGTDKDGLIQRAVICREGRLTEPFLYLKDYAFESS